jgi:hypothetical protein
VSVERRERKQSTRMTQHSAVMLGGETQAHRRGAGLSFATAQTGEQMTAHGHQPRTATPAGDAKGAIRHAVENGDARSQHTHALQKHPHHCKQEVGVGGAGKSRRALSPWCHVAYSGRLSGVLSAWSVDRWARVWRGEGK